MANVLVGVCGSIAAYRSPDFIRELKSRGHELRVVLTDAASQFVTPKTIETFLGSKVLSNNLWSPDHLGTDHIDGARWADAIVVYGATANFIAKLRQGFCDDFLTLQISATKAPIVLCPAMNVVMWESAANQENCDVLKQRKINFVGPCAGTLACGEKGLGHIEEHSEILKKIEDILSGDEASCFFGKKVLLSLGSMRTPVDEVRFLQNSSSGRMGLELAKVFLQKKAHVHLLAGLCEADVENEIALLEKKHSTCFELTRFQGVVDYEMNLKNIFSQVDLFVSAAAILDFEVEAFKGKIDRKDQSTLSLNVKATQDFVAWAVKNKKSAQKIVAFALESGSWPEAIERAQGKLLRKGADAIVVNRCGAQGEGPFANTNQACVLSRHGLAQENFSLTQNISSCVPKEQVAKFIISELSLKLFTFKNSEVSTSYSTELNSGL
jgi:phosphopantothenoylcysteine decarboxylase/phosphopantothenate--cysteine ligase